MGSAIGAIVDLPFTPTLGSICISPTMLLYHETVGVAVGISLLSSIESEIFVIAYVLPVNGGHLLFTSHTDVGKYPRISPTVLLDLKNGGTRRKSCNITFE